MPIKSETPSPPAAVGESVPETQDIVLLVPFRKWRDGRVLIDVPGAVAQKLVSTKLARPATRRDRKISGSAATPYTEEE